MGTMRPHAIYAKALGAIKHRRIMKKFGQLISVENLQKKMNKVIQLFFILILVSNCQLENQLEKSTINIQEYIYPNLKNDKILLYEYEGANREVYDLKYMLIERDTNLSNSYKYSFLDSQFEFLSGYVEIRHSKVTEFKKMLIVDIDSNNMKIIQEVDFDKFEIPFELEMNKSLEFSTDWKSKSQNNIRYSQKSSRKLIEIGSSLDISGNPIKTITIQTNDKIEVSNSQSVYKNVAESTMKARYGMGIGLVDIEVKFANNLTSKAKLKLIHRADEIESIRLKSKIK